MFDCVPKTPLLPVKKREVNYLFTFFCIILYYFINFAGFIDIKQTLHYKIAIE